MIQELLRYEINRIHPNVTLPFVKLLFREISNTVKLLWEIKSNTIKMCEIGHCSHIIHFLLIKYN